MDRDTFGVLVRMFDLLMEGRSEGDRDKWERLKALTAIAVSENREFTAAEWRYINEHIGENSGKDLVEAYWRKRQNNHTSFLKRKEGEALDRQREMNQPVKDTPQPTAEELAGNASPKPTEFIKPIQGAQQAGISKSVEPAEPTKPTQIKKTRKKGKSVRKEAD